MDKQTMHEFLNQKIGKPVSSFTLLTNFGASISERFVYTTELSRILLVGEPRVFEDVRYIPVLDSLMGLVAPFYGWFFYNRFENFIKSGEKSSQGQLQDAIEDAIVLTSYNTSAYSVSKLLDYLSKALQGKIGYIKEQITYDSKWDHKSVSALKKWGALAAFFTVFLVVMNKYIVDNDVERIEGFIGIATSIATLGLLPALYQVFKNCYKVLTINPNVNIGDLAKYEELLLFVQKLKDQLKTNGFISFTFQNGHTATIANDIVNTLRIS